MPNFMGGLFQLKHPARDILGRKAWRQCGGTACAQAAFVRAVAESAARLTAEGPCIAAARCHMIAATEQREDRPMRRSRRSDIGIEPVAGNGLLDRRIFLAG